MEAFAPWVLSTQLRSWTIVLAIWSPAWNRNTYLYQVLPLALLLAVQPHCLALSDEACFDEGTTAGSAALGGGVFRAAAVFGDACAV